MTQEARIGGSSQSCVVGICLDPGSERLELGISVYFLDQPFDNCPHDLCLLQACFQNFLMIYRGLRGVLDDFPFKLNEGHKSVNKPSCEVNRGDGAIPLPGLRPSYFYRYLE